MVKLASLKLTDYLNTISVTCIYAVTLFVIWLGISPHIYRNYFSINLSNHPNDLLSTVITKKEPKFQVISGKPAKLTIPAISFEKNISDGIYYQESKTWSLGGKTIHYALLTPPANNYSGNTLIYGHNNKDVFGPLKKLQNGDKVEVLTDNNQTFTYRLINVVDYDPNDTSLLNYSGSPILTLQTCAGTFNEIREMYIFEFEGVV